MTNRKAIEILREKLSPCLFAGEWKESVDVAISALQAQELSETQKPLDTISRQAAIDALKRISFSHWFECGEYLSEDTMEIEIINSNKALEVIEALPSARPERTCVNCGRTANNGGWYADGGTRCPIEEHYALPKDGYCHLWEKRNVTDDDYPERRTDE